MDKGCVFFDGYCVYNIGDDERFGLLIDYGEGEPSRVIVPLFRIANGVVRPYQWNGDISGEEPGSDYECLKENIEAARKAFNDSFPDAPIKTTVVAITNDGRYGLAVIPGLVVARIKEEVIKQHC